VALPRFELAIYHYLVANRASSSEIADSQRECLGSLVANENRSELKDEDLAHVLGYLNFSSGKSDPKSLAALNRLYGWALAGAPKQYSPYAGLPAWLTIQQWLQDRLGKLRDEKEIFRESDQASQVLQIVWLYLLPDYLDFHSDLLFHQEPEGLFNGLLLGRAIECVLQQGGPWDEIDRIVPKAIDALNDYVGFRPVAVLEGRRLEPYAHEWLRPIPLYIRDVGVAFGPYHDLIQRTLEILRSTSQEILRDAQFEPLHLDELALDPRAYDFDHPVNKRPNYYFGQWDPNLMDQDANFRRFVLQQVTVDALLARVSQEKELSQDETLTEAAAVLAGTMLMASGISGGRANSIPSTTTLVTLLSQIAIYRDSFYEDFLVKLEGPHAERLQAEAAIRRQPLGGARQQLNTNLARLRASQVEHVQLARIFARMGSATAAKEESDDVQVPSARILCRVDCLLTVGNQLLRRNELEKAGAIPEQIFDLIQRGIQCGALVDPWNILGFAGNFPRFVGSDSTVADERVDELVQIMEQTLGFLSRLWREAAATNQDQLSKKTEERFRWISEWWRKYAAHQVSDVGATDPQDSLESSQLVARALRLWHQGGAAAGDLKFWAPHADMFDSPKAYALVIEALLDRRDFVGGMALLVHWLSQAARVGLQSGNTSYSDLARMWLEQLFEVRKTADSITPAIDAKAKGSSAAMQASSEEKQKDAPDLDSNPSTEFVWSMVEKFFDYLEANGETFWSVPEFALSQGKRKKKRPDADGGLQAAGDSNEVGNTANENDETDSEEALFGAAYEGVTYLDSTDDGVDGPIFEEGQGTAEELVAESKRLGEHLTFLAALAQMWKLVAQSTRTLNSTAKGSTTESSTDGASSAEIARRTRVVAALRRWSEQCLVNRNSLVDLLDQIQAYKIPKGGTDTDSMARYDRQRVIKESLMERILAAAVETADAGRMLIGGVLAHTEDRASCQPLLDGLPKDEVLTVELFGDLMAARRSRVEEAFSDFLSVLRDQKLLYVSLARGGQPRDILNARVRRRALTHLLTWLPRQGFFYQSCRLVDTARHMEHHNPVGHGAVTEFDDLFQIAFKSMVRCLVRNAYQWQADKPKSERRKARKNESPIQPEWSTFELDRLVDQNPPEPDSDALVPLMEQLTEVLLGSWLSHSRTLRLSILETIDGSGTWKQLSQFIQKYGKGLFTQGFLKLSHVRAILHQGVPNYLEQAIKNQDSEEVRPLLEAIENGEITIDEAQRWLAVVFEAIIDHYAEYKDYNSTTTQSDRGEMLYMLLDFLRLRVRYDRVCWNLKPVFWAHEVLVHTGCQSSAQQWRRALADRVARESDMYLEKLTKLQELYAMKMPTVADRLNERFVKPMTIDRMRALIRPAMRQLRASDKEESRAFELLVQEAHLMMREPTGVGLDIPAWLLMLEEEVERVVHNNRNVPQIQRLEETVPVIPVSVQQLRDQFNAAMSQNRSLKGPES
jgi:hypothetical protein